VYIHKSKFTVYYYYYVTKVPKKDPYGLYLYFEDLESLRRELIEYWLQDVDEDLREIERAVVGEEVRCY
jgi:hypothetical protein